MVGMENQYDDQDAYDAHNPIEAVTKLVAERDRLLGTNACLAKDSMAIANALECAPTYNDVMNRAKFLVKQQYELLAQISELLDTNTSLSTLLRESQDESDSLRDQVTPYKTMKERIDVLDVGICLLTQERDFWHAKADELLPDALIGGASGPRVRWDR